MKRILTVLALVLSSSLFSTAQDTFRIAVVGSSHVAQVGGDLVGGSDSLWHRKYAVRMQNFTGRTVILYQINSSGARTIGSIDARRITGRVWNYTNYEYDFGLVDSVLKVNPHLVIISAQSNEITNGMPCDTVIACYNSVADTLKARGVLFIFTDGFARQRTFINPITAQTYHDSTVKFNNFLYEKYNRNTARMYIKLYDSVVGYRPFPFVLGPDSLHTSAIGKTYTLDALLECPLSDSLFANFVGKGNGFSFKKVGANLNLKINFKGRKVVISGSNNYSTFVPVKTFYNNTRNSETITESFADVGYLWYKIEAISGKRMDVITKRIN